MRDSFADFGEGLLIAAILVYLVMVAQFRSLLLPLVILVSVPLGLIGVVPMLWVTGTYLSIPAFMGLILMVGIVVQYSILVSSSPPGASAKVLPCATRSSTRRAIDCGPC